VVRAALKNRRDTALKAQRSAGLLRQYAAISQNISSGGFSVPTRDWERLRTTIGEGNVGGNALRTTPFVHLKTDVCIGTVPMQQMTGEPVLHVASNLLRTLRKFFWIW
jgi:hypothetical protein